MKPNCRPLVICILLTLVVQLRAEQPAPPIDYPVLVMFVKNALTALNHGNLTGNYSVLRDLGSEGFRQKNTAADLATAFAKQRQQRFDLSPILVSEPQFTQQPTEVAPGKLKLVGYFPTQPQAVQFAVVYHRTDNGWGIDEIVVAMTPLPAVVQARPPQSPVVPAQYQQPIATR
jgi:hypothetical protein